MRRKEPMHTVGFRLSGHHVNLLEKGAAPLEMSAHEYARYLLIAALDDTERERLKYEVAELREELVKHREEFALSIKAILDAVHNPKRAAPERVEAWVEENLRT